MPEGRSDSLRRTRVPRTSARVRSSLAEEQSTRHSSANIQGMPRSCCELQVIHLLVSWSLTYPSSFLVDSRTSASTMDFKRAGTGVHLIPRRSWLSSGVTKVFCAGRTIRGGSGERRDTDSDDIPRFVELLREVGRWFRCCLRPWSQKLREIVHPSAVGVKRSNKRRRPSAWELSALTSGLPSRHPDIRLMSVFIAMSALFLEC